jgi:uncharacterized membrane protein YhhN
MRLDGRAWLAFALIGAVVAIASQMAGVWALHAAAKPATTIAIWGWARTRQGGSAARRRWVEAGLALSLAGDVALMWPQGFIPGLVAFLLAHLAYIVAFSRGVGFARHKLPFVAYGAVAAAVLSLLWPHIGPSLKPPVLAYVVCLACMAAQALAWWLHECPKAASPIAACAARAAMGGALFMVSDASLAINKFMQPLPAAPLIVLSTYWVAQVLIASSLASNRSP